MVSETSYGFARRLEFASRAIEALNAKTVLDLGCGSGVYLLAPLAQRFPGKLFVGVDSDPASINAARRSIALPNVRLSLAQALPAAERFDLVIASEVIEHVESPPEFLAGISSRLAPGGRLLLTLPNGFGAAEWSSFVEAALRASRIFPLLRGLKRLFIPPATTDVAPDTYAVSPHINFFSHQDVLAAIEAAGYKVVAYQPRGLLCGFGWDFVIRGERLTAWNQSVADRLPPTLAADWMFLLEPTGTSVREPVPYRRSAFARLRRRVNEAAARA